MLSQARIRRFALARPRELLQAMTSYHSPHCRPIRRSAAGLADAASWPICELQTLFSGVW